MYLNTEYISTQAWIKIQIKKSLESKIYYAKSFKMLEMNNCNKEKKEEKEIKTEIEKKKKKTQVKQST